ncbi:hypothetical protein QBC41DRAFT_303023 [Cercophora samala]|uniref:Uncharacterized protein n=1 Tax=Cercophora samala TaxID=330535 RepID=A0AA39ZE46_9PEZI|nr:hypothetical protein QBC41DRAFT_303023 [Cercophora samala]
MSNPFATLTAFGPPSGFIPPGATSTSSPSSSSSSNSNDGNGSGLFSADHPWAWVLIPVLLLSSLGLLAACLHNSRRRRAARKALHDSLALSPSPRSRPGGGGRYPTTTTTTRTTPLTHYHVRDLNAQRDLESGWLSPGQEAARWAWPPPAPREEGLNELGEAPPPYENNNNGNKEKRAAELGGGEVLVEAAGAEAEAGEGSGREIDGVELQELDGREVGAVGGMDLRRLVLIRGVEGGGAGVGEEGEGSVRSWVEGDDEIDTRSVTTAGTDGQDAVGGKGGEEKWKTGFDSSSESGSEDGEERGSGSDHVYDLAEEVVITQPPPAVLRDSDSERQQRLDGEVRKGD